MIDIHRFTIDVRGRVITHKRRACPRRTYELFTLFLFPSDRAPPGPQEQRGYASWRRARASRGFTHIFRRYNSTSTTYGLQVLNHLELYNPPHPRSVTTDESQPGPQSRVCDAAGVSRRAQRIFGSVEIAFRCPPTVARPACHVSQPSSSSNRADRIDR